MLLNVNETEEKKKLSSFVYFIWGQSFDNDRTQDSGHGADRVRNSCNDCGEARRDIQLIHVVTADREAAKSDAQDKEGHSQCRHVRKGDHYEAEGFHAQASAGHYLAHGGCVETATEQVSELASGDAGNGHDYVR